MKKFAIVLAALVMTLALAACGSSHCKECDNEVYQDGYCEYHYALHQAENMLGGLADSILG